MNSKELAKEISELRFKKEIEQAIERCEFATKQYPNNNFFYKILGDLYIQIGDWQSAKLAYINLLIHLRDTKFFKQFARFFYLYQKQASANEMKVFIQELVELKRKGVLPASVQQELISSVLPELSSHEEILKLINENVGDSNYNQIKDRMNSIVEVSDVETITNYVLKKEDVIKKNVNTCMYLASFAEKHSTSEHQLLNETALQLFLIAYKNSQKRNPTAIRAIFRICRKKADYSEVEDTFSIDKGFIDSSDFNIQYELVYYFDYKNDSTSLNQVLRRMRNGAESSIPIARTLYNFYLMFNKFDEANELSNHINHLESADKMRRGVTQKTSEIERVESRIDAQNESDIELRSKMQELISEQEHNRQMIAIRDLLKGFSHELGQPITNIRYAIQYYNRKQRLGKADPEDVPELLDKIIKQTERIGTLLQRFRPIVSSKSIQEEFRILNVIWQVYNDLSDRISDANIITRIEGDPDASLFGDQAQFEQVFYNLFLNSIQAINSEGIKEGMISIQLNTDKNHVCILFSDNGPGIPSENIHKIFTPFFSTKDPLVFQDGGEGLGLYIVWNVLKIFNGTIKVDANYTLGARFIIELSK
ncbi:HAMP domain-containing sensor histidine kinase [Ruminococcus flavefaciens]|uniref:sensor histidine kinase n=1 Tax=Ruminococcus flavefaciens TaxID=1265 RepID=UPI0026F3468A|nr:HAMP domain-containing sensor histidine kinase [Ruminococcus flavefaciens]